MHTEVHEGRGMLQPTNLKQHIKNALSLFCSVEEPVKIHVNWWF